MQHEDKSHAPKNLLPAPLSKDDERRRSGSEKVGKCWNQSEGFGTTRISLHCRSLGSQSGTCHSLAARREYFPGGGL